MGHRDVLTRTTAAWLVKLNGAWLISIGGEQATDSTPDETITCARSLATAKRVARDLAGRFGFEGVARWTQHGEGRWELEMVERTETWDGEYDDE